MQKTHFIIISPKPRSTVSTITIRQKSLKTFIWLPKVHQQSYKNTINALSLAFLLLLSQFHSISYKETITLFHFQSGIKTKLFHCQIVIKFLLQFTSIHKISNNKWNSLRKRIVKGFVKRGVDDGWNWDKLERWVFSLKDTWTITQLQ